MRDRADSIASRLVCHGCGNRVPLDEIRPYRCRAGEAPDNIDHVLRRVFDADRFKARFDPEQLFGDPELNPYRKFRRLFYSHQIAELSGVPDATYLEIVDRLDQSLASVDGAGFRATPLENQPDLAREIGLEAEDLWVKDETGNVSGSHKARHLMGIMLWLEIIRTIRRPSGTSPPLAIASCGNAALAAAVVARAAVRPLEVFVPPDANRQVTRRLVELGAKLSTCPRQPSDPAGDPCFLRFLEAWREGALPFTVQAKRNGLTLEGGCTLIWEVLSELIARGVELDHLVVQVGGGALAASCVEGLANARDLGLIDRLPRIHTVQTESCYPLRRAYDRIVTDLTRDGGMAAESDLAGDDALAIWLRDELPPDRRAEAIHHAAQHRSDYMWPWETPPRSIAYGILDDETYDWIAVVEGMLATGGLPVVVSESTLATAHALGSDLTGIAAEPTGTAGLAGLIDLRRAGAVRPGETVALLFTGVQRSEPPPHEN